MIKELRGSRVKSKLEELMEISIKFGGIPMLMNIMKIFIKTQ